MTEGILIIDKPEGLTSHDVVARVRRLLKERRVGHTGTLDPFATGVMVVLIGRATRLAQFLSGAEKEYEAVVRFGYATDTGDATGARLDNSPAQNQPSEIVHLLNERALAAALDSLRGEIEQVPPMYSAKKVQGRKLYELARRGLEIERAPVRVMIHALEAERTDGEFWRRNEDETYDLQMRVVCSAGTYIRTLAEAIGERLGVGAHLAALRRTRAGDFRIAEALSLDQLAERVQEEGAGGTFILSPDAALSGLPFLHLTADEARRTQHGIALRLKDAAMETEWSDAQPIRMLDANGRLLAVGFYDGASRTVRPRVVLSP